MMSDIRPKLFSPSLMSKDGTIVCERIALQNIKMLPHVSRMWKFALNSLFYLGATPYKCLYCRDHDHWYLKTSKLQLTRSLVVAWLPLFIRELSFLMRAGRDHLFINKPSAKSYLLFCSYMAIYVLFVLIFRALFWQPKKLSTMLNCIYTCCIALQKYTLNQSTKFTNVVIYLHFVLIYLVRVAAYIFWLITYFFSDNQTNLAALLYKRLVQPERNRLSLPVSKSFSYTLTDCLIALHEAWGISINDLIIYHFQVIITGIVPVTFLLSIRSFEGFLRKHKSVDSTSGPFIIKLFEDLEDMSKSINLVWGLACLAWVVYIPANVMTDLNEVLGSNMWYDKCSQIHRLIIFCLLLYLSGEVYCKVEMFKKWLTEYNNWHFYMSSAEMADDLNRVLVQLDGCCFGIGKPGVYKMSYGFASQLCVVMLTLAILSFTIDVRVAELYESKMVTA